MVLVTQAKNLGGIQASVSRTLSLVCEMGLQTSSLRLCVVTAGNECQLWFRMNCPARISVNPEGQEGCGSAPCTYFTLRRPLLLQSRRHFFPAAGGKANLKAENE